MFNTRKHIGRGRGGFNSGNGLSAPGGAVPFSVAYSFLMDGANEYFNIPSADLIGDLQGSVIASWNFYIYPTDDTILNQLWSNGSTNRGVYITHSNANVKLNYTKAGTSTVVNALFPANAITYNALNFVSMSLNTVTGVVKLKVNGAEIAQDSATIVAGNNVKANADDFRLFGGGVGGAAYYKGYGSISSVIDKDISLAEHIEQYHSGKPLSAYSVYDVSDILVGLNPDSSGATAQFAMVDAVKSITATSVNLEDADKTTAINFY